VGSETGSFAPSPSGSPGKIVQSPRRRIPYASLEAEEAVPKGGGPGTASRGRSGRPEEPSGRGRRNSDVIDLKCDEEWRRAYAGTGIAWGWMVLRCGANPPVGGALEAVRRETGEVLRRRFGGLDRKALKELPVLREYEAYYGRFDKSYHVRLQLESVAFKGREVPPVSSLVTPMFLAELEDGVLTAGHDLDRLVPPVTVRLARVGERFALLGNRKDQEARAGDQALADGEGIVGTILHGPDHRTRLDEASRNVLYVVYGVPGVGEERVRAHLERIRDLVRLALPEAGAEGPEILRAEA